MRPFTAPELVLMNQLPQMDLNSLLDRMMSCELLEEDILETLPTIGVSMVINLSSIEEMHTPCEQEAKILSAYGIEHAHIPVFPPLGMTRRNVVQFGALLATTQTVLVHAPTRDRIGAMVALLAGWCWGLEAHAAIVLGQRFGLESLSSLVTNKLLRAEGGEKFTLRGQEQVEYD